MERNEPRRIEFRQIVQQFFSADQLVSVDETSVDECTTPRTYGRAPAGEHAIERAPFNPGQR